MAILIVIFDGAVPQFLAKYRLLHTVGVRRTGNATVQDWLVFVSNEHIADRTLHDSLNSARCAVPYGIDRVAWPK